MSICYPFPTPTTGVLSFSTGLSSLQPSSSHHYQQVLLDADNKRALVRDTLKRVKKSILAISANNSSNENYGLGNFSDTISAINAIENYIPLLFDINYGLQCNHLQLTTPIVPSWRLPIKVSLYSSAKDSLIEPPRVEIPSLTFEQGMILFTLGLKLISNAELALAQDHQNVSMPSSKYTSSLPSYMNALDDEAKASQAESSTKWKKISTNLQKAQSLFKYLLQNHQQYMHHSSSSSSMPQHTQGMPSLSNVIDLSPTTLNGLISLISGSLHLTMIYKAQEQQFQYLQTMTATNLASDLDESSSININSSYPKDKAKAIASPSLYIRVAIYAAEQYSTAIQLFSTSLSNIKKSAADSNNNSSSSQQQHYNQFPEYGDENVFEYPNIGGLNIKQEQEQSSSSKSSKMKKFFKSSSSPSQSQSSSSPSATKKFASSKLQSLTHESPLLDWLKQAHQYCLASASLFAALDCYTKKPVAQVGIALRHLYNALDLLDSIKNKKNLFKAQYLQFKIILKALIKAYEAENNVIACQPVPTKNELGTVGGSSSSSSSNVYMWPSGRLVIAEQEAWKPPVSSQMIEDQTFRGRRDGQRNEYY